jgi:hypothetical protein
MASTVKHSICATRHRTTGGGIGGSRDDPAEPDCIAPKLDEFYFRSCQHAGQLPD